MSSPISLGLSQIITTPCDTDFYKLTMKAAIHRMYPEVQCEFAFVCRTPGIDFTPVFDEICRQIRLCDNLHYMPEELEYIASDRRRPVFSPSFIRFLSQERWNSDDVSISLNPDGSMNIRIRGTWMYVTDWEIFILAIISEVWSSYQIQHVHHTRFATVEKDGLNTHDMNISLANLRPEFCFTDFGTRRRSSKSWHERSLRHWMFQAPSHLLGTSNIHFARTLDLPLFGTHAHEWDSAHLSMTHPLLAKKLAMHRWLESFDGDAGITLTDTFTTGNFLDVFTKDLANAFTGVRHDSGDWMTWANRILAHYSKLGIDSRTKTLLFSDGLTFERMLSIYNNLHDVCRVGFGIGTNFTNATMFPALQIVIKMVSCNGSPVLKISDDPVKTVCEDDVVRSYMLRTFCP